MFFSILDSIFSRDLSSLKMAFVELAISLPIILLILSIHETAHGFVANKLGDPTAKNLGRLTLNPLKHIDPFGMIVMVLLGFGWAKPVPINTRYFKKPKRDMALTALAGPISNLLLALIFAVLLKLYSMSYMGSSPFGSEVLLSVPWRLLGMFLYKGVALNVMFAIFNMIPVPPFDGSRLFLAFLPSRIYFKIQRYERYIYIGFMLLLLVGVLDVPLNWLFGVVLDFVFWIFNISFDLVYGVIISLMLQI